MTWIYSTFDKDVYELLSHLMPRLKKLPPKEVMLARSHTLTPTTEKGLKQLSQDASDFIGWTVSNSAVVRALVRYAAEQSELWQREHLFPFIEREMQTGTVWGKQK